MNSSKASLVNILDEDKCIIVDNVPCQCDFELPVGVKAIEWDIDSGGHLIFKDESQYLSVSANDTKSIDEFYHTYVKPYVKIYYKEQDRLRTLSNRKNRCHNVKECIKKKKYEILEKFKIALGSQFTDYADEEIGLFPQLYEGACIYILVCNSLCNVPHSHKEMSNVNLLKTIAHTRDMDTLELARQIVDEYKNYINIIGQLIGQKQNYICQLKSLGDHTTIKKINSIEIQYTVVNEIIE